MHLIDKKNKLTIYPGEQVGLVTTPLPANNIYSYPVCDPECLSIMNTGNIRGGSDYNISKNRCIRTTNIEPVGNLEGVISGSINPISITNFSSCSATTDTRYPLLNQYVLLKNTSGLYSPFAVDINNITVYDGINVISTDSIIVVSGRFMNNTDISPFTILNNTTNAPTSFVIQPHLQQFILIDLKVPKYISHVRIQQRTANTIMNRFSIYLANDTPLSEIPTYTLPTPKYKSLKTTKVLNLASSGILSTQLNKLYDLEPQTLLSTRTILINHRYLWTGTNQFNAPGNKLLKGFIYTTYTGKSFIPITYDVTGDQLNQAIAGTLPSLRTYFDNSVYSGTWNSDTSGENSVLADRVSVTRINSSIMFRDIKVYNSGGLINSTNINNIDYFVFNTRGGEYIYLEDDHREYPVSLVKVSVSSTDISNFNDKTVSIAVSSESSPMFQVYDSFCTYYDDYSSSTSGNIDRYTWFKIA
jgi:hypothetical protein